MKDNHKTKKKDWEKPKLNKLKFKHTFDGVLTGGNELASPSYS